MDISNRITGAESAGNPIAQAKTSSAFGLGQFINGTWLGMIKRHRPDLALGKSDAEILQMRADPVLSKEMTAIYAEANQEMLRKAGLSVTPGSTYLMHFAGPGGGVKLLKADPNAPVESILDGNAIKANSFLRGKTVGWVIDWANKKMANPATSKPVAVRRSEPWIGGGQPVPHLASSQAVDPAFAATSWLQRPASPNEVPSDAVRPFAGAPSVAPIPFADKTVQAQQALDDSLPAPGAAPWDLSDRFGKWNSASGVFGPASSGENLASGQTGDGSVPGLAGRGFARVSADPSGPLQQPVPFPLHALLGPDRDHALDQWALLSPRTAASPRRAGALADRPDLMASITGISSSQPDQAPAGGLLGMIQDYMRNNAY